MKEHRGFAVVAVLALIAVSLPAPQIAHSQARDLRSPLHWAARHGLVDIAAELLESGTDINHGDILGRTPLHVAVRYPSMVSFLVSEGANLNPRDHLANTPLHAAIWAREPRTVDILVSSGAEVNAENTAGYTPLDLAIRNGTTLANRRVVARLVAAGAR